MHPAQLAASIYDIFGFAHVGPKRVKRLVTFDLTTLWHVLLSSLLWRLRYPININIYRNLIFFFSARGEKGGGGGNKNILKKLKRKPCPMFVRWGDREEKDIAHHRRNQQRTLFCVADMGHVAKRMWQKSPHKKKRID